MMIQVQILSNSKHINLMFYLIADYKWEWWQKVCHMQYWAVNFSYASIGPDCVPQSLALCKKTDSKLDTFQCLAYYSDAKVFDARLSDLLDKMYSKFKNAAIIFTNTNVIKYDFIVSQPHMVNYCHAANLTLASATWHGCIFLLKCNSRIYRNPINLN